MKVILCLETAEERQMLGVENKFVEARSTALFFRREMVPLGKYDTGVPVGYKEKLYVEVALDSLVGVKVPIPALAEGGVR